MKNDREIRRLHRQLLLSSVAILLVLSVIALTGSFLISDIVRRQNVRYYQLALDFTNDAVEQIYIDVKNLFDQMLFSPQFDKLMNYKNVDYTDLLIGLKQLGYCKKANAYVDSIYLYNAQNDTFYITSDYSTQAVQQLSEMFDAGAVDIVNGIHEYSNLVPVERTARFAFPFYNEVKYVTFVRYNALSKGKTNVLIINIEAEKLSHIAEAMKKTENDQMFFARGGEVILEENADDSMAYAAKAVDASTGSKEYIEIDGKTVIYDKTLPFDWTLIYICDENGESITANETGLRRVVLMIVLTAVMFAMFTLILLYWIRIIKKKNVEARLLREERKEMELLSAQHNILKAMAENNTLLLSDQRVKVARLVMITPGKALSSSETVRAAKLEVTQSMENIGTVFMAEDNEGRLFICVSESGENENVETRLNGIKEPLFAAISDEFMYPYELSEAYQWCVESAEYASICEKRWFTTADRTAHEASKPVAQEMYADYVSALQSLAQSAAEAKLSEIIRTLATGEIHNYKMGVMTLIIQTSNTLSQMASPGSVAYDSIDREILAEMKPEEVYAKLSGWIQRVLDDVIDMRNSRYDKLAGDIAAYIEEHCPNVEFTADTVAKEFGFSAQYLSRVFKKQTGEGIGERITAARIRRAKTLLTAGDDSIAQVAAASGFMDVQYFHKVFKTKTGMTPGAYRQEAKDDGGQDE